MGILFFLIVLFFGALGGVVGQSKGRTSLGFWLGFLLGPIGVIAALFLNDHSHVCPECGGFLAEGARRCMHCGQKLLPDSVQSCGSAIPPDDPPPDTLPCPYCYAELDASQMVHGRNRCGVCRREFNAD